MTQRLYDAAGVEPIWVGLCVFLAQLLLFTGYAGLVDLAGLESAESITGRVPVLGALSALNILFAILIAYAPTATAYSRRAAGRLLDDLRPALDCSDADFASLREETLRFEMPMLRAVGICFVAGAVVALLPTAGESSPAAMAWVLFENAAAVWLGSRTIAHELEVSRGFSQLGLEHARVDLLDARPLAPLGQRGVQGALVLIIEISLFSMIGVVGVALPASVLLQIVAVALALLALWIPLAGAHGRIVEEKRRKVDQLAREIGIAEQRMMSPAARDVAAESARLSALIALQRRVEDAREWPVDSWALVRFALYLALGLSAWVGAAIVIRLLDAVLGRT